MVMRPQSPSQPHALSFFSPLEENHNTCFSQAEFLQTSALLSQNHSALAKRSPLAIKTLRHLCARDTEKKVNIKPKISVLKAMLCSKGISSFYPFLTTVASSAVPVTQIHFIFQNNVLILFAQKSLQTVYTAEFCLKKDLN